MSSRFLIYGLTEPDTGAVRYVGLSTRGLARAKCVSGSKARREWILGLRTNGQQHGILVLEEARTVEELDALEPFWIAQGLGLGWDLLNVKKGGLGPSASIIGKHWSWTVSSRLAVSASRKGRARWPRGRKFDAAWRAKLSAAAKRRSSDPMYKAEKTRQFQASLTPEVIQRRGEAIRAALAKLTPEQRRQRMAAAQASCKRS